MAKVAMCAGHGGSGSTPGKRSPAGEYEWNFNDAVVRAAIAKLKANGVEVLRTDDASGKTDVGLTARTNKANAWGADTYVSVHHNALGTKWLNYEIGIETFTQNGSHPQAERLARCIHPKYVKAMGLKDRGMKKSNLAITRQTKMPAVLTEGGFMDSRIDIKAMRSNAKLKAQGEAIADGIMEFLNVKNNKDAPKTSKPKQTQTGSTQIKSISAMADEVIAGKHGSGHENRRKSLGISKSKYEKVRAEVNRRAGTTASKPKPKPTKTISQMATEVINGRHGSGHTNRRNSLGISQEQYNKVRAEVNRRASGSSSSFGKSISQMATEVIQGKHGSGHANRRKSLGISQSQYNKVRAEVNKRL